MMFNCVKCVRPQSEYFRFHNTTLQFTDSFDIGPLEKKKQSNCICKYISPPASFDLPPPGAASAPPHPLPPPAADAAPLPPTTRACKLHRARRWRHPHNTAQEGHHEKVFIGCLKVLIGYLLWRHPRNIAPRRG